MYFSYNHKKLKDYRVNKKICLYYRGMIFLPLNIEEKIAISILEEEIEVEWSISNLLIYGSTFYLPYKSLGYTIN